MAPSTLVYRKKWLSDLANDDHASLDGQPSVEPRPWLNGSVLQVPEVAFGEADFGRVGIELVPRESPGALTIHRPPQSAYVVRNATVHGQYGILTLGDAVVADTLMHLPLHCMAGAGWEDDQHLRLPSLPISANLQSAYHLLACNIDNFFHWIIDALTRFRMDFYTSFAAEADTTGMPNLLLPQLDTLWKQQSTNLLLHHGLPRVMLTNDARMVVQRLLVAPELSGHSFNPHPALLDAFDAMRATVMQGQKLAAPWRRLFVSRADTTNRRLINEQELAARAEAAGFTIVSLSGMPVHEQVRLFSEASHIIAPHGAGLTNLGFCHPGAVLCELHMNSYVHWAFRRLAALRGVRYGCLVGEMVGEKGGNIHGATWTLNPVRLDEVLAHSSFAGTSI